MIILNVVLDMIFVDWIVKKKKIYRYFEMSFSCFGPFGVWAVTCMKIQIRSWVIELDR